MGFATSAAARAGISILRGWREKVRDYAESAANEETSNTGIKVIVVSTICLFVFVVAIMSMFLTGGFPQEVERWRGDVIQAETNLGLDTGWTNHILALMQVESGGNTDVHSVRGVANDIMQAAEGQGGHWIYEGSTEFGFEPQTPQASIHAGVEEFMACIASYEKYLGRSPSITSSNDLGLLTQGYNYGHVGWFSWLAKNGYNEYSVEISRKYQSEVMGGAGTANHGQKCMDAYAEAMANARFSGFGGFGAANYVMAAYNIAMDDSIGYSQSTRCLNPNVDCSSFVYYSLLFSGYSVEQLGSSPFTTFTMGDILESCGFVEYSYSSMRNNLQTGDILVRSEHTEIVYDPRDSSTLGAHSNYDGRDGDSSGREVNISPGNAQGNWTWVYRK